MSIEQKSAIIDIGSNSVRLVVYGGPPRAPFAMFNEKVLAGLGRDLKPGGLLTAASTELALRALARFRHLLNMMDVQDVQVVATAAVREAANGADFLKVIAGLGFSPIVLSGEEEAEVSGFGVLSTIPDANGIAGDLGGGSLELIRISNGDVQDRISLPFGSLRIPALRAKGPGALSRELGRHLRHLDWVQDAKNLPFYMVGGSWRALARLHMHRMAYPLPILAGYEMPQAAAARLVRMTAQIDKSVAKKIPTLSASRIAGLNDAASLLLAVTRDLDSSAIVTCASGLREGLLFRRLAPDVRQRDPLLEDARAEGLRQGRFDEHGHQIYSWIAPLFEGEARADARIRHAACLLGDVAWQANPEFRAERGTEIALQGNWTGASHRDRVLLACALNATFGGGEALPDIVRALATEQDVAMARSWGLAIRLAQRWSGGTAEALRHGRLTRTGDSITLTMSPSHAALGSDQVQRRLKALAQSLGLSHSMKVKAL
jgi:exopolyphosphatase/guanosine-5'-triphosphate,3'-diphosphate pyrophosphatase